MVRDWDADLVGVEDPVVGALEAKLLVPVPGGTSNVRDRLSGSKNAFSIVQIVSSVAGKASASAVKSIALIRNRDANFVSIENPVVRALQANLFVPVP